MHKQNVDISSDASVPVLKYLLNGDFPQNEFGASFFKLENENK